MKRSLILCGMLIWCAVVSTSCEKDEAPVIPFLTVDISQSDEGTWLFATNERGELLDIVRVDNTIRGVRQFNTNKRFSSIDFSVMNIFTDQNDQLLYYGTTYRNVPSTMAVDAGYPPFESWVNSPRIGTVNFTVNNYPGKIEDVRVVTNVSMISSEQLSLNGQRLAVNFEVVEGFEWFVVSARRNGVPVYYRKELQAGNTTLDVDFNSFVPMENLQTLTTSQLAEVSGIFSDRNREPINFLSANNADGMSPPTLGTVPGFERYTTIVSRSHQRYYKIGAPIRSDENIEAKFINFTVNVTDRNLAKFSFSSSIDYDYKSVSTFMQNEGVSGSWIIYSSATDEARMLFDFPKEIVAEFPAISTGPWPEGSLTLYKSPNSSYSYSDFLNAQLTFNYKSEFEQLMIFPPW